MSFSLKNKFSATALAVCTVLGVGYSTMASAGNTTTLHTNIVVLSTNTCTAVSSIGSDGSALPGR
ncbi:hypothetical protein [Serratia bockelmannii]|uniref:hypothetical protein n=1 Tax=Serratia bockelmannii TaxID=2703793 RepID=UPI00235FA0EE|nr:hypothetical protein [Serratia bockelmannii]